MNHYRHLAALALAFLLGIQDGYIALWKDGSQEPVEVFPFKAELLPPEDQEKLKTGIRIENSRQLTELMEDYLS